LFQRTRQKGLSPRCHDFYDAHQEQVELMDEFRKASLGGKTDPTAAMAGLVAELAVPMSESRQGAAWAPHWF
jgi:hypothetical protein